MKYLLILILLTTSAQADELVVSLGGFSHHFADAKFNDRNLGLGVEYQRDEWAVLLGSYANSEFARSHYISTSKRVLGTRHLGLEVIGGLVSGYDDQNRAAWAPYLVPAMTWHGDLFGARVMAVPPSEKGATTIAVQLLVEVWK